MKAKNLEAALAEARARRVPLVVALDFPDTWVRNDVRSLLGPRGKMVFLSLRSGSPDATACRRRFGLQRGTAVLCDEYGNVLQRGLRASSRIADAYASLDELIARCARSWRAALEKGRPLVEEGRLPEAAVVLRVFAHAEGGKIAKEGRRLFDRVAEAAREEYKKIVAPFGDREPGDLDAAERKAFLERLTAFMKKWPDTPAAWDAEDRIMSLTRAEAKGS